METVGDMATCSSEFCPNSEQVVSGLSGVAGAVGGEDGDQTTPSPPTLSAICLRMFNYPSTSSSAVRFVSRLHATVGFVCFSPPGVQWAAVRLFQQMASSCVMYRCCTDGSRRRCVICSTGRGRGKKTEKWEKV